MGEDKKGSEGAQLELIHSGDLRPVHSESLRIVIAPAHRMPFAVDAVVAEEDTYLVLSADRKAREVSEHPVRVMTEAFLAKPAQPGTVLVRGARPYRMLAVVHDLNQDPTWTEDWVANALSAVFHEAEKRGMESLALPFIGTVYGTLDPERFLQLLKDALAKTPLIHLRRLWLVAPGSGEPDAI